MSQVKSQKGKKRLSFQELAGNSSVTIGNRVNVNRIIIFSFYFQIIAQIPGGKE